MLESPFAASRSGLRAALDLMKDRMMTPKLASYHKRELPEKWFYQIISFLRMDDPAGFAGRNQSRNWISEDEEHVRHFVMHVGDILISHPEVLRKDIEHEGLTYRLYGLGGVLTYPAFRRQGHGTRVVRAATQYAVTQPDADVALLTCSQEHQGFYAQCGWEFTGSVTVHVGPREAPVELGDHAALHCISDKARDNRAAFEEDPVYFGVGMW